MKLMILTRSHGIDDITSITHPILKKYAYSCNADFFNITKFKINKKSFHNEIFQTYDFLDEYDRICLIDSDILLNNLPNIFNIVPYESIGVSFEDNLARKNDRLNLIKTISKKYNVNGWNNGYINTGFMVVSKIHKDLFNYRERIYDELGFDDLELSYRIFKHKFNIYRLNHNFNHMSSHSEVGFNWLKSYVIHYAGRGFYKNASKSEQIKNDLFILKNVNKLNINFVNISPRIRLILLGLKVFLEDRFIKKFS